MNSARILKENEKKVGYLFDNRARTSPQSLPSCSFSWRDTENVICDLKSAPDVLTMPPPIEPSRRSSVRYCTFLGI